MIQPSRGVIARGGRSGGDVRSRLYDERGDGANLAESRARNAAVTCEDCFFRRRGLCALGLDSPCPTFRPDTPEGLVPPRQPALLVRDRGPAAHVVVQAA
jgi:hypothetical protein